LAADLFGEQPERPETGPSLKETAGIMSVTPKEAKAALDKKLAEQKGMVIGERKKTWLEKERKAAWKKFFEDKLMENFVLNLRKNKIAPKDKAEHDTMFEAFKQTSNANLENEKKYRKDFEERWEKKQPEPDATLVTKWETEADELVSFNPHEVAYGNPHDMGVIQQSALYDDLERDFVTTRMKGKKGGFWANIAQEFARNGLFEGVFD
jgi:hypothetical protein